MSILPRAYALGPQFQLSQDPPDCQNGCPNGPSKCCNYQPRISNFQIALSIHQDPKSVFVEKLKRRTTIFPIGEIPPSSVRIEHSRPLCQYYSNGECSIWPYRDSECALYFCNQSIASEQKERIFQFEQSLMQFLLIYLGYESKQIQFLLDIYNNDIPVTVGPQPDALWTKAWAHYANRELDFFRDCHKLFNELPNKEFKQFLSHP